jgi:hypothetical protein
LTPDDFVFSLKASRYLTHVLRMRKPTEPVRRLLSRSTRPDPRGQIAFVRSELLNPRPRRAAGPHPPRTDARTVPPI